jgi:AraC-like DNA-binding protein
MSDITNTIYEIMVYINLNLFEHITLDSLSNRFSYSKYHLHRKFKDTVGITLREAYTWIIKYYFPRKGLMYDYRVQFHEYSHVPDLSKSEISCKIYIPISYQA